MLEQIDQIIKVIDGAVWGLPLIILILFTGFLLTTRLGLLQIRHLGKALKFMFKNEEDGRGRSNQFRSALYGAYRQRSERETSQESQLHWQQEVPGALFWMVIAAFFGMATKYAEGSSGYQISHDRQRRTCTWRTCFTILKTEWANNWRWLAKIFAFFGAGVGLFGIGTFTQVNSIASAVKNFFDPDSLHIVHSVWKRPIPGQPSLHGLILDALCRPGRDRRYPANCQSISDCCTVYGSALCGSCRDHYCLQILRQFRQPLYRL